jgi:hypothetical protein
VVAQIEDILERGTKATDDQGIVVAFRSKPLDGGDANATKTLVYLKLVLQLR